MKKFLVKTISRATDNNPNFAGLMSIGYYGKNQKLLKNEGSAADAIHFAFDNINWMLEEYGYNRACDAKKSWIYKNPENTKFWTTTAEIIEYNI